MGFDESEMNEIIEPTKQKLIENQIKNIASMV